MYYIYTLLIPLGFALTTTMSTPAKAGITQTVALEQNKAQIQDVRSRKHRHHSPYWKKHQRYHPGYRHHDKRHFYYWRF